MYLLQRTETLYEASLWTLKDFLEMKFYRWKSQQACLPFTKEKTVAGLDSPSFEAFDMDRSTLQKRGIVLVLLISSPWLLCQAWIAVGAPNEAFTAMPSCPDTSSNCAHLGGGDTYRMDGEYTLTLNATVEQVWSQVEQYIDDSGSEVLVDDTMDSGERYVHFVERTTFWRFPDDISISVKPLADGSSSQLEMHSQSRLGQGDLGVNPNRIDSIYQAIVNGL